MKLSIALIGATMEVWKLREVVQSLVNAGTHFVIGDGDRQLLTITEEMAQSISKIQLNKDNSIDLVDRLKQRTRTIIDEAATNSRSGVVIFGMTPGNKVALDYALSRNIKVVVFSENRPKTVGGKQLHWKPITKSSFIGGYEASVELSLLDVDARVTGTVDSGVGAQAGNGDGKQVISHHHQHNKPLKRYPDKADELHHYGFDATKVEPGDPIKYPHQVTGDQWFNNRRDYTSTTKSGIDDVEEIFTLNPRLTDWHFLQVEVDDVLTQLMVDIGTTNDWETIHDFLYGPISEYTFDNKRAFDPQQDDRWWDELPTRLEEQAFAELAQQKADAEFVAIANA